MKVNVKQEGDAIWLQLVGDASGPLKNQDRIKLVRVE